MQLPLELTSTGIPTSEPGRLRRIAQRTTVLRLALGLALVLALAFSFLVARQQEVRQAPLVPAGTTGMLVLDLSASVYEGALDVTIAKLVDTDERTGLVVFSDSAYELLPPGSPSRELQSLLRLNVTNGSVVLVSDLEILLDEIARLSEVLAQIREDGYEIRIVPL